MCLFANEFVIEWEGERKKIGFNKLKNKLSMGKSEKKAESFEMIFSPT
jgi:hypothetical protein